MLCVGCTSRDRWATPAAIKARSRVADEVAFLASPAARWISGGHAANPGQIGHACAEPAAILISARKSIASRDHRSAFNPSGANVPCTKLSAVTRFSSNGRIESTISLSPVQGA
jgi:hypothetical protein